MEIGVADVVVGDVFGRSLSKRMLAGQKLIYNQRVRTGRESATTLEFNDKTRMSMGERAEMLLDDLVFDPKSSEISGLVQLTRGVLRFASAKSAKVNLVVRTPAATIGIRGTVFDLYATARRTEVTVLEGQVQVSSQYGAQNVGAGRTYSVNSASGAKYTPKQSSEMQQAVTKMVSMVGEDKTGARRAKSTTPKQK
jgi:hypothetical protein